MIIGDRPRRSWKERFWLLVTLLFAYVTFLGLTNPRDRWIDIVRNMGWLDAIGDFILFCFFGFVIYNIILQLLRQHHLAVFHIDVGIDALYPYLKLHPYGFLLFDKEGVRRVTLNEDEIVFCDENDVIRVKLKKDGLIFYDENQNERTMLNEDGLIFYDEHFNEVKLPERRPY